MSLEKNKSLFNRFGEALNARDFDAVRELLAPDFARHCQATPDVAINTREQFIEYLKMDDSTFPDSVQTAELVVAEGDLIAFWLKYEGTQKGKIGPFPPSNKKMQLDIAGVFRVRDGKFAELWITWDNLASLTQLGHFPPRR